LMPKRRVGLPIRASPRLAPNPRRACGFVAEPRPRAGWRIWRPAASGAGRPRSRTAGSQPSRTSSSATRLR
jgi:hypothetical protein